MSSRDWAFRMKDMIQAINKIESYLGKLTLDQFRKKELVIDAVIRNFITIGEAGNSIPSSIRRLYPNIPWSAMNAMCNLLILEYSRIDIYTVWHAAKYNLPVLKKILEQALSSPSKE
jgi:uncharacterized protein with HEPN domain